MLWIGFPSAKPQESRSYGTFCLPSALKPDSNRMAADGDLELEVVGADLSNGLLSIDLTRPEPERIVRKIAIASRDDV